MFGFTGSRHPIVCLPMNRVSDLSLAIAVSKSGCLPSITMSAYTTNMGQVYLHDRFKQDMIRFVTETESTHIMLSATDFFIIQNHQKIIEHIKLFKITHLEVIPYYGQGDLTADYSLEKYIELLIKIKSLGVKIIVKCLSVPIEQVSTVLVKNKIIDGIIVKSSRGAGKVSKAYPDLSILIKKAKSLYPNIDIIGCGGIVNSQDIKIALEAGASAVGIGTAFAMSRESKISIESKKRLLSATKEDVKPLDSGGVDQNAIIFDKYPGKDNDNNTLSLEHGVAGKGGHVFVGYGIDQINEILSVAEIVNRLTQFDISLSGGMNSVV